MNAAQIKRYNAVRDLIDSWVESMDPIANGQIIRDASFNQLIAEIQELGKLGRSDVWHNGLIEWQNLVSHAEQMFRETVMETDNHEMFTDGWEPTWEYRKGSHNVRKDYARLFKWALHHGAIKYVLNAV